MSSSGDEEELADHMIMLSVVGGIVTIILYYMISSWWRNRPPPPRDIVFNDEKIRKKKKPPPPQSQSQRKAKKPAVVRNPSPSPPPPPPKQQQLQQPKVDFSSKKKKNKVPECTHPLLYCTLKGHKSAITSVAYGPDYVITASEDRTLRVWQASTFSEKEIGYKSLNLETDMASALATSKSGLYCVAAMESKKQLCFYGVAHHNKVPSLKEGFDFPTSHRTLISQILVRDECAQIITSACDDTHVFIYSGGKHGTELARFDSHTLQNYKTALSNNGRFFAIASKLSEVKVYELLVNTKSGVYEGYEQCMALKGHKRSVTDVAFTPDNQRMVTAGVDGEWRLWNINVRYAMREEPKVMLKVQTSLPAPLAAIATTDKLVAVSSGTRIQFYSHDNDGRLLEEVDDANSHGVIDYLRFVCNLSKQQPLLLIAASSSNNYVRIWKCPSL